MTIEVKSINLFHIIFNYDRYIVSTLKEITKTNIIKSDCFPKKTENNINKG